jgi:hypothetical protein
MEVPAENGYRFKTGSSNAAHYLTICVDENPAQVYA